MTALPPPRFVDTHCHLDLYADVAGVVARTANAGVYTIAVTNTPSVFGHLADRVRGQPRIRVALGLHPELAAQRVRELPQFEQLLPATRYVGEIGLDHTAGDRSVRAVQRRVFGSILTWCDAAGDKVLTLHSRRAADDVIDAVGATFRGAWILHWYSGSARALARALANGAYVSVNPAMVRSDRSLRVLDTVPIERVLTETDGPFVQFAPVPADVATGGLAVTPRPAEPSDVSDVVAQLAQRRGETPDALAAQVWANFTRLLRN